MASEAVGWDWLGINLFDGSALTAFELRRADGSALWAGGSFRSAAGVLYSFGPKDLKLKGLRQWRSPSSAARYPVQWQVDCPAGRFILNALLDTQELDSSGSTGAVYWEGLSELTSPDGKRVGLGYLEMTGYAKPLRLP
jgi:predicted secreted hydrolase